MEAVCISSLKFLVSLSNSLDSPEDPERLWLVTLFSRATNVNQSVLMLGDSTLHTSKCTPRSRLMYHLNVMLLLHRYFLGTELEILPYRKLSPILKSSKKSKAK